MKRGEIWWADLEVPSGSEPGHPRPVLIVQCDEINASNLATVIVLSLTSNLRYKSLRGCVCLPAEETGLPKDSVANTTQLATVSKVILSRRAGAIPDDVMHIVDETLRATLAL